MKSFRRTLTKHLVQQYYHAVPEAYDIYQKLLQLTQKIPLIDHLAIIDLPGPHTGISYLLEIFQSLGYEKKGQGYLADKQNDFVWLAEVSDSPVLATEMLAQIVIADFRLDELPQSIRDIVYSLSMQAPPFPRKNLHALIKNIQHSHQQTVLLQILDHYFKEPSWLPISLKDYHAVFEFNELLAWVCVFGRQPNHITFAIHLLSAFENFNNFLNAFLKNLNLPLNEEGGLIKGNAIIGLEQSSTCGTPQTVHLPGGTVELPRGFVEFVWRHALDKTSLPQYGQDYFRGFIAEQADHVIKSLNTM